MVNLAGLKTRFLNYPIRRKLMLIVLVTSVIVMGMTAVIFYVEDIFASRRHEVESRRSIAEIICRNSRAGIRRNNRAHVAENLKSLAGDPHIQSAWVVLASGEIFASYVRQPGVGVLHTVESGGRLMVAPGALTDDSGVFSGLLDSIKVAFTCTDEGNPGCTTVIISDSQDIKERMRGYLGVELLVLWVVTILGYLVISRLQGVITDPLTSLVNTMERIRTSGDYSLRAGSGRADEIGTLADCFNRLLCEVETNREQLHLYQDKLSEMIAVRTAELVRVKEEVETNISKGGRKIASPEQIPVGRKPGDIASWQDERRRLYALMECVEEEIWFISACSGPVLANRPAGESLGISLSDCLDQEALAEGFEIYSIDQARLHRADLPPFRDLLGASVRGMEVALLSQDDVEHFQLINAEPYRNSTGEVGGTVFVVTDITTQKETEASLRAISGRLFENEELLRKSLAAELHDEIGRDLAVMNIYNETIRNSLPEETRQRLDDKLSFVQELVYGMSCKIANIIGELRPPLLDDFGLVKSLKALADTVAGRHGIEVDLVVADGFHGLSGLETAIYRIIQEALDNAVKHSGADSVMILLEEDDHEIRLVVSDNGCGFDPEGLYGTAKRPSWGVTIMRERAELCGGRLSIESAPGAGTKITVSVRRDRWP